MRPASMLRGICLPGFGKLAASAGPDARDHIRLSPGRTALTAAGFAAAFVGIPAGLFLSSAAGGNAMTGKPLVSLLAAIPGLSCSCLRSCISHLTAGPGRSVDRTSGLDATHVSTLRWCLRTMRVHALEDTPRGEG